MSEHISSDNPHPAGCTGRAGNMKKHEKIIIKEKYYGKQDLI